MNSIYFVIEGIEGLGKTTQCSLLYNYLTSKGYKVLATKEPGSPYSPLTMELRNIMLNAKYEGEITPTARELVSQAIRSIHIEKVIVPALDEYDFIIQDRGILSGLAYGEACGNDIDWLMDLADNVCYPNFEDFTTIYDTVVCFTGNSKKGLERAQSSKQEFKEGDAIEMRGSSFMDVVNNNMLEYSKMFNTIYIDVDGKDIQEVFSEMITRLGI